MSKLESSSPRPRAPVCALIDGPELNAVSHHWVAENFQRLRRQLDHLGIEEVFGLGDIPAGSSFMVVRLDMVFAYSALAALAERPGCGAHFEDTLAAVHVEAGDAAAALAKFRRQETTGWQPFHIHFFRLGPFEKTTLSQRLLGQFGTKSRSVIARAAQLRTDPHATIDDQPIDDIWQALPGLDRFVGSIHAQDLQLLLRNALGLKPSGWQAIGFLLLLVMLSFGAFGWIWLGAAIGLFAAGLFDLAQRSQAFELLQFSRSPNDLCIQALVTACLWLFAVFAAGQGAVAKMPALVLITIPLAFIAAQASRRLLPPRSYQDLPFGLYLQALLVCAVVASLPAPLLSIGLSAFGLATMLALIFTVAIRLGIAGLKQNHKARTAIGAGQPAE